MNASLTFNTFNYFEYSKNNTSMVPIAIDQWLGEYTVYPVHTVGGTILLLGEQFYCWGNNSIVGGSTYSHLEI